MQRVVWLGMMSVMVGALAACGHERETPGFRLQRVGPTLVEPGTTLRIEGDGLPVGESCEVRLRGRTFRPGLASLTVSAALPGRTVSPDAVELRIDERAIAELGAHGSFEGQLQVFFAPQNKVARVTHPLTARLDVSEARVSDELLRERARRLLRFAGIVASEDASMLSGLELATLERGAPAEALGLHRGEVITRVAGVTIHSLADLAPPPHARTLELRVRRPGEHSERVLSLALAGLYEPDLSSTMSRLSLALGWLLLCMLLLSPLPSLAPWLGRALWRLRHSSAPTLGLWGGELASHDGVDSARERAPWRRAISLPVWLSAAGIGLVYFEPAGFLAVRSLSIYLGFLAVSITLTLMSDGGTLVERVRTAGGIAGRMLVMGVLIACGCALYGTRSFDGMVDGQGAWPWCWALLQKPALLVAFPLYVVFASRLGAATLALEVPGHAARLLVAERVLTNVVLCALGIAIFAGGWQSPRELHLDGLNPRLLGALLFVGKAWALAWLLSLARRIELGAQLDARLVVLGCLTSIALTALWLWLPPTAGFELALGRALCGSLTLFAVVTALRVRVPHAAQDSAIAMQ